MKDFLKLSIIALIGFCTLNLYGQGCEEPSEGESEDGIQFFGFFQSQYDHVLSEEPSSTFKFKRARIGIKGDIPYDFSYYVVMENSAFVSKTGNPYLLDAFISYKRFKWAKVSVGSFKQPFGLEVNTACHSLHTIERALVSDQIVAPQRDMGVMILGGSKETFVKYSLGLMNGNGLNVKDNNAKKDVIGRVIFHPLDFLSIGGNFRYGYPNVDSSDRVSVGAELQIETGNFLLQGEYIYDEGDYNRAAGGGCGSEPMVLGEKRDGYFVQAMYMTRWMVQPVAKFESFDTDKDLDNSIYWMTFGVNYWFNDWTRVQLNYQYKAENGAEVDNDAIMVQLQVKF